MLVGSIILDAPAMSVTVLWLRRLSGNLFPKLNMDQSGSSSAFPSHDNAADGDSEACIEIVLIINLPKHV
jgi:hypothetical protein